MRPSQHPCFESLGLQTCCSYYKEFPPFLCPSFSFCTSAPLSLCRVPGSANLLCAHCEGFLHSFSEFPGLQTCCAHYKGVPTIPALSSWVCKPAVLSMRGSHHPCRNKQDQLIRPECIMSQLFTVYSLSLRAICSIGYPPISILGVLLFPPP